MGQHNSGRRHPGSSGSARPATMRKSASGLLRMAARFVMTVALLGTISGFGIASLATSAQADSWVGGCHYVDVSESICIRATMGGKNYGNHTQWAGWVNAYFNTPYHDVAKLEAWGDGFYFATSTNPANGSQSATWGAQRWVHSGTNICAAATFVSGARQIACISVSV